MGIRIGLGENNDIISSVFNTSVIRVRGAHCRPMEVPEIDLGVMLSESGSHTSRDYTQNHDVRALASDIVSSLQKCGLIFIKNHGIPAEQIDEAFRLGQAFFTSPDAVKADYRCRGSFPGWRPLEQENYGLEKHMELKESLNLWKQDMALWPRDNAVPGFTQSMLRMTATLEVLSTCLLRLLAVGLNLEDTDFFLQRNNFPVKSNPSQLRFNYYPSLEDCKPKPGQLRIGEHSDSATFTLLFQTDVNGYQAKSADGSFFDVKPIPYAALFHVGDFLQRWTSDRLVSTIHRVVMPEHPAERRKVRQSLAYFVLPDVDKPIECIDGSDTYPPVYVAEYTMAKFKNNVTDLKTVT